MLRVILIGNYALDAQESMQRYGNAMLDGLKKAGVRTELMLPPVLLGRFGSSSLEGLGKWLGYLDKFVLFPFILRSRLRMIKARLRAEQIIVHICDHSNAMYTKYLSDVPHLTTCHDMLAIRSAHGEIPENPTRWSGRCLQEMILAGIRRSQQIVCVSEATRTDALRLTGLPAERISTIPTALNYPYSPIPSIEACIRVKALWSGAGATGLGEPFLLHVGGNQWYKNRLAVLRIHARLGSEQKPVPWLVLVGKPLSPEMKTFLAGHPARQRVVSLESCGNEDLRALYSTASALLFPSLAEGFGWPVVEAQACGCPVVCSNIPPFPEVAGDGAIFCNVKDESTFTDAIRDLLSKPELQKSLVQRGFLNAQRFQSARMIDGYLQKYRALAKSETS